MACARYRSRDCLLISMMYVLMEADTLKDGTRVLAMALKVGIKWGEGGGPGGGVEKDKEGTGRKGKEEKKKRREELYPCIMNVSTQALGRRPDGFTQ